MKLEKREKPEVQRLLLCDTVLLTRQLGIQNVRIEEEFDG